MASIIFSKCNAENHGWEFNGNFLERFDIKDHPCNQWRELKERLVTKDHCNDGKDLQNNYNKDKGLRGQILRNFSANKHLTKAPRSMNYVLGSAIALCLLLFFRQYCKKR